MSEAFSGYNTHIHGVDEGDIDALFAATPDGVSPTVVNSDVLVHARETAKAVSRYQSLRRVTRGHHAQAARYVISSSPEVTEALLAEENDADTTYRRIGTELLQAASSMSLVKATNIRYLNGPQPTRIAAHLLPSPVITQLVLDAHRFIHDKAHEPEVRALVHSDQIQADPQELPLLLMAKLYLRVGLDAQTIKKYEVIAQDYRSA